MGLKVGSPSVCAERNSKEQGEKQWGSGTRHWDPLQSSNWVPANYPRPQGRSGFPLMSPKHSKWHYNNMTISDQFSPHPRKMGF